MKHGAKLVFYRTLLSQSAASITMGSLAAALRSNGHPAELCLLERNALDNTCRLANQSPAYPIIIAKPNFKDYLELFPLLSEAKMQGTFKRVFFCGPFAAIHSQDMMARVPWVDGIIEGEPEETSLELLASTEHDLSAWNLQCAGGIWRNPATQQVIRAARRAITGTLDDLVFPARDIEMREEVNYVNLEASRGCYYNCSFCHVPLAHGQAEVPRLRIRSPKRVVDEIEYLKTLGKTLFIFNDSTFWGDERDDGRIMEFCDELKKRRQNIHYYVYLRCNPWPNDHILRAMVDTGLVRVFLGVENSSPPTLDIYRKYMKVENFFNVKKKLDSHNVNIHLGYITFQPYSTLDEIQANIDFLHDIKKLYRLGVVLEPVRVIPRLALHNQLVRDDLLYKDAGFDGITYGYKYAHPEVGRLHQGIRMMFEQTLNYRSYSVEYNCVAGQLARTLAERTDPVGAQVLTKEFAAFDAMRTKLNNVLQQYFNSAIAQVRHGATVDDIASSGIHAGFVREFNSMANRLSWSWGILSEGIRSNCGERVIKEVFTKVEGI